MNEQIPMLYADRIQFIVATMTKDYEKARDIANKILKDEPDNTTLQTYLSIFDKGAIDKSMQKRLNHDTESDTESDSESSTGCNSGSNSDTDTADGSCQSTTDDDKDRTIIEPKKFCQRFETGKTSNSSNGYYTEDNAMKIKCDDFKGKMIRVLPIRLSGKIKGAE